MQKLAPYWVLIKYMSRIWGSNAVQQVLLIGFRVSRLGISSWCFTGYPGVWKYFNRIVNDGPEVQTEFLAIELRLMEEILHHLKSLKS